MKSKKDKLLEELAAYAHNISWIGWMKYFMSKCCFIRRPATMEINIPMDIWDRWMRQMETDYKDLPENEKESDKEIAKQILKIIEKKTEQKK